MDGVSLETEKWARVLETEGFTCHYLAGELDRPPDRSCLVPEAHFQHPEIVDIQRLCFGVKLRSRSVSSKIHRLKERLKDHIYRFIQRFEVDLLIAENALTIPLNIPLAIALTEVISETGINTIAHHHDFYWERQAFDVNACADYLNMAFPPRLNSINHVVINSFAGNQLSHRAGISSVIIPNVMDFENPPPAPDDYSKDVRGALGLKEDELMFLQPTRVVRRKGIEHAIEFVHRFGGKSKLVISHASGDEGYGYEQRVREYSRLLGVDTLFVSDIIGDNRGRTSDGRKIYSLFDVYPHADLVTYFSDYEGFGNAVLEAFYFQKPIVVNNYSIYATDIKPKGFHVVEVDGFVTDEAVHQAKKMLNDSDLLRQMATHNYEVARRHYSFEALRSRLKALMADSLPCRF